MIGDVLGCGWGDGGEQMNGDCIGRSFLVCRTWLFGGTRSARHPHDVPCPGFFVTSRAERFWTRTMVGE